MNTLLDRPPDPGVGPSAHRPGAGRDAAPATAAVDLGVHLFALCLHACVYAPLVLAAVRFDCGPHLLAGVLVGDCLGSALRAAPSFRRAPVAAAADCLLFAALFVWSWSRYAWPDQPEFRALSCLAGFGALAARIGLFTARARGGDGGGGG